MSKQSSFLELPPFESVMEDKIINVCFEKEEEVKKDEKVKKEEQTKQVDIEKEKTENVGIENPETSDEIIIFLLIFVTSSVLIFVLSRRLMTLKKQ